MRIGFLMPLTMKGFGIGLTFEYSLHIPAFDGLIRHLTDDKSILDIRGDPLEDRIWVVDEDVDSIDRHILTSSLVFG